MAGGKNFPLTIAQAMEELPLPERGANGKPLHNLAEIVLRNARLHPAAPALIFAETIISHRQAAQGVRALAAKLSNSGVRAGQTVGVTMGQNPLHLLTQLALAYLGAVALPLHPAVPADRRLLAARRYGVSIVISGRQEHALEGFPFALVQMADIAVPSEHPAHDTAPADPLRIALSSGTSGDPKGVLFSHGYMLSRLRRTGMDFDTHTRLLSMDLNFAVGFVYALAALAFGGAVVFTLDDTPGNVIRVARLYAVTHWQISPAAAGQIAAFLPEDDWHFPDLRCLRLNGAMPSRTLVDTLFHRFTPHVHATYASTECGVVAHAGPDLLAQRPDCAGHIAPWMAVQAVDGHDQPLPAGQTGRLRIRAEGMPGGYHLDPDHSAARFRGGWYYPGDLGHIDLEGLLSIAGREDDVINVNGTKIRFNDVEHVFESHPAVREAAAFIARDPAGREQLALAFVAKGPVAIGELERHGRERLGPLAPRLIFQADEFPHTETGKVLRGSLTARFSADGGTAPSRDDQR